MATSGDTLPLGRSLGILAGVLAATAASLWALDQALAHATGRPRGVVRASGVEDAAARLKQTLLIPAYFPAGLEWPPAAVTLSMRPPAVCLSFRAVETHRPAALLCQTARGSDAIPARLLPPVEPFHSLSVTLEDAPASLSAFRAHDGAVWQELGLRRDGSLVVLRFRGGAERFLRLAASLRRGRS